jgi:oxygen-independent coproporphyrinogen-3 oxidase
LTVAGHDQRIPTYLTALEAELGRFQPELPRAVDSVYLGGGTPSRMTPAEVARLLGAVRARFRWAANCEVTLEANPEDLDPERLAGYREAGVTRLSVGLQSLDDRVLGAVGRACGSVQALGAVGRACEAGFRSVNADLILGLPGEKLAQWGRTLQRVAAVGVDHLSVYLLETDKPTPLGLALRHGRAQVADDDALAEAYGVTVDVLASCGLELYEISNFARPGHRSRHNLKYWTDAPYGGFGLGAHAYSGGERRANRRDLRGYVDELAGGRDPQIWSDGWHPRRRLEEAMVLGLRLVEGVDLGRLSERYGLDAREGYREAWERAGAAGLVERLGDRVRLTARGRMWSNELFAELITV